MEKQNQEGLRWQNMAIAEWETVKPREILELPPSIQSLLCSLYLPVRIYDGRDWEIQYNGFLIDLKFDKEEKKKGKLSQLWAKVVKLVGCNGHQQLKLLIKPTDGEPIKEILMDKRTLAVPIFFSSYLQGKSCS